METRIFETHKIDFGKCKDFNELCGVLNLLGITYSGFEDAPNRDAIKNYFEDEKEDKENGVSNE